MSLREELNRAIDAADHYDRHGVMPTWARMALTKFVGNHGQALLDALEDAGRAPSNVDDGLSVAYMVGRLDGQGQPSTTALIAYVLDNYEGHAATEESMNIWLSECIESAHSRSADQAIDAAIKGDG